MENGINAWEKVQLARDKERPYAADYIEEICDEFMELHGDRLSGDDGALIGGIVLCHDSGTAEGPQRETEHEAEFRHGLSRRISQGSQAGPHE